METTVRFAAEAASDETWVTLLVGFGGALVGALAAGGVTIWVARWQAREQLRLSRLDKLDSIVFELQALLFPLAESLMDGHLTLNRMEFVNLCGAIRSRAGAVAPHLAEVIEEGSLEVGAVVDRMPAVHRREALPAWRGEAQDNVFALHDMCMMWLTNPADFEQEKPSFGVARAERKRLRERESEQT